MKSKLKRLYNFNQLTGANKDRAAFLVNLVISRETIEQVKSSNFKIFTYHGYLHPSFIKRITGEDSDIYTIESIEKAFKAISKRIGFDYTYDYKSYRDNVRYDFKCIKPIENYSGEKLFVYLDALNLNDFSQENIHYMNYLMPIGPFLEWINAYRDKRDGSALINYNLKDLINLSLAQLTSQLKSIYNVE